MTAGASRYCSTTCSSPPNAARIRTDRRTSRGRLTALSDRDFEEIHVVSDLNEIQRRYLEHCFEYCKNLDTAKGLKLGGWGNMGRARTYSEVHERAGQS